MTAHSKNPNFFIIAEPAIYRTLTDKANNEILVRITKQQRFKKIDDNPDNNIKLADEIGDIEVLVTDQQRYDFLRHFNDKASSEFYSWQTATFSHILQSEMAKYQKEQLHIARSSDNSELAQIDDLMLFIGKLAYSVTELEADINNPDLSNITGNFTRILAKLASYEQALSEQIDALISKTAPPTSEEFKNLLANLKLELTRNIADFRINIDSIITTSRQTRKLFSIQDESPRIQSLGSFVCGQMKALSAFGIDRVYQITDNRFNQALRPHAAIKAFSTAKSKIEKKGESLGAVRYNDSRQAHPRTMLRAFKPCAEDANGTDSHKWLSLHDYVNLDDLEDINEVLNYFSKNAVQEAEAVATAPTNLYQIAQEIRQYFSDNNGKLITNAKSSIGNAWQASKDFFKEAANWIYNRGLLYIVLFCAIAIEIFVFVPIRLALEFVSVIPFGILGLVIANFNKRVSTLLSNTYEYLSPVRRIKIKLAEDHSYDQLKADQKEILQICDTPGKSTFNLILTSISGYNIGLYIIKSLTQIFFRNALTDAYIHPRHYFLSRNPEHRKQAYESMRERVTAENKRIIEDHQAELTKFMDSTSSKNDDVPKEDHKHIDKSTAQQASLRANHERVQYCSVNRLQTPLDFFEEIFDILTDALVDHSFRESPVLASVSAAIAIMSLAAFHGAISGTQFSAFFKALPSYFSKYTMGKEIDGLTAEMFALFVQWKLTFVAMYGTSELIYTRDLKFLREIVREPEKLTLGLMIVMSTGYGLGILRELFPGDWSLPTIPTPGDFTKTPYSLINSIVNTSVNTGIGAFDALVNVFPTGFEFLGDESINARGGIPPFTYMEYAFLGVKTLLFVDAMISGTHHEKVRQLDIHKFAQELIDNGVDKIAEQDERINKIAELLAAQGIDSSIKLGNDNLLHAIDAILNNYHKTQETAQQPAPAPVAMPQANTNPDLQAAAEQLKQALATVNNLNLEFSSETDARLFYDYLDDCFENYNNEIKKMGRYDKCIDSYKKNFMHSFYNKYCYNPTTNFLRFISIVPFFFITYPWRALKYYLLNTPSTRHQVIKSNKKDAAMILQILAFLIVRPLRAFVRLINYTCLRAPILALAFGPILLMTIAATIAGMFNYGKGGMDFWRKSWNWIGDKVSKINIHRLDLRGTISLRPLFNLTLKPLLYIIALPIITIGSLIAGSVKYLFKFGRSTSNFWHASWNIINEEVNPYKLPQQAISSSSSTEGNNKISLWEKFKAYLFSYNDTMLIAVNPKPLYASLAHDAGSDYDDLQQKCKTLYEIIQQGVPRSPTTSAFDKLKDLPHSDNSRAKKCLERAAVIIDSKDEAHIKHQKVANIMKELGFFNNSSNQELAKRLEEIQETIMSEKHAAPLGTDHPDELTADFHFVSEDTHATTSDKEFTLKLNHEYEYFIKPKL